MSKGLAFIDNFRPFFNGAPFDILMYGVILLFFLLLWLFKG